MSLNVQTKVYGALNCRVVDVLPAGRQPSQLVVLCHGFGAPGTDLVSLAPWLMEFDDRIASTSRFVFPAAPIDLGPMGMPGGRAWWPINMARLAEMHATKDFSQLTELEPPGMNDAGEQLAQATELALRDSGLTVTELVLGGFSQGAMVSTQVVLQHQLTAKLLVLFSGTLLNRAEWRRLAELHPGCAVLQSHGRQDPLLPYSAAVWLRDMLTECGFQVEFEGFNGTHSIPEEVLQKLGLCLTTFGSVEGVD